MQETRQTACIIIQARMTSSRLPGKVLMELGGKPALELMISRLERCKRVSTIIVATTSNQTDDAVANLCKRLRVSCVRGDEFDVLGRMCMAAEKHPADYYVRLTADCPFADPLIVDRVIEDTQARNAGYGSNILPRTYPDGLDVEVVSAPLLHECAKNAVNQRDREHVTTWIRNKLSSGSNNIVSSNTEHNHDLGSLRWTLDTEDDYKKLAYLADNVPSNASWVEFLQFDSDYLGLAKTGNTNRHGKY
jgi:spore coat polysaccharide biosynthesis protein SpsF (cytidylyltransferase family)